MAAAGLAKLGFSGRDELPNKHQFSIRNCAVAKQLRGSGASSSSLGFNAPPELQEGESAGEGARTEGKRKDMEEMEAERDILEGSYRMK